DQAARRVNQEASIRWADDFLKNKASVARDQSRTPEQREAIKAKVAKMAAARVEKAEAKAAAEVEADKAVADRIERSPSWLKGAIKKAAADDVFDAITETWSADEITKLVERCREYLNANNAKAA